MVAPERKESWAPAGWKQNSGRDLSAGGLPGRRLLEARVDWWGKGKSALGASEIPAMGDRDLILVGFRNI